MVAIKEVAFILSTGKVWISLIVARCTACIAPCEFLSPFKGMSKSHPRAIWWCDASESRLESLSLLISVAAGSL